MDSKLVISWMKETIACCMTHHQSPWLFNEGRIADDLQASFRVITFQHIPREFNKGADALSKKGCSRLTSYHFQGWKGGPPPSSSFLIGWVHNRPHCHPQLYLGLDTSKSTCIPLIERCRPGDQREGFWIHRVV